MFSISRFQDLSSPLGARRSAPRRLLGGIARGMLTRLRRLGKRWDGLRGLWRRAGRLARIAGEGAGHRAGEERATEYEGVELAVLAARIDAGRQLREKPLIVEPAREVRRQRLGVHTADDGAKAKPQKFRRQLARIPLP